LKYLQKGQDVPRGTIQTQFLHRPFDEARRLGLMPETEKTLRENDTTEIGVLIASVVLPEGPADGSLSEGDVLIKINGEYVTKFVPLEEMLDSKYLQRTYFLLSNCLLVLANRFKF
jgi:pro-apoptotic serine protease NMA111